MIPLELLSSTIAFKLSYLLWVFAAGRQWLRYKASLALVTLG